MSHSSCPFCGQNTVSLVLDGEHSLAELDAYSCSGCSNRWCVPQDAAHSAAPTSVGER